MLVKQLFVCSAFLAILFHDAACVRRPGMRSVTIASLYNLSARVNDHFEVRVELRTSIEHFGGTNLSAASLKIALGVFTHSKGRATVSTLLYFPSQVRTYWRNAPNPGLQEELNDRTLNVTVEANQLVPFGKNSSGISTNDFQRRKLARIISTRVISDKHKNSE